MRVRTWWERLLELLGLVRVLENKRVDESVAADLELDVAGLFVLLYPGSCGAVSRNTSHARSNSVNVHLASLRRQISMNCLMSETSEGILMEVVVGLMLSGRVAE